MKIRLLGCGGSFGSPLAWNKTGNIDINNKRMQTGNTANMIFSINFILSYLSNFMTLLPGDIITTGTPPGVGDGKKPPIYLKKGDKMRLEIDFLGQQLHEVK